MFLKPNVLNSLMKQAYKTGLVVARTTDNWIQTPPYICEEASGKKTTSLDPDITATSRTDTDNNTPGDPCGS